MSRTPIHASWLNQIELYFSIVQRKALIPNDFGSLEELRERLLGFQARYAEIARPYESGPSPGPISIACSPGSPSANRSSSWRRERTCGRVY